jgi:hypothetical protein
LCIILFIVLLNMFYAQKIFPLLRKVKRKSNAADARGEEAGRPPRIGTEEEVHALLNQASAALSPEEVAHA